MREGKPHSVVGAVVLRDCMRFFSKYANRYSDNEDDNDFEDIIKIPTNIILYDKNGNVIDVPSIPPSKPLKDVFAW